MFTIKIKTDSDAFLYNTRPEISRILRNLADQIENGEPSPHILLDINGNKCGFAQMLKD